MSKQYQQIREKLMTTSTVEEVIEFINDEVQKAFKRGQGIKEDICEDSVSLAQQAHIHNPEILSNLYSKERGLKL